MRKDFQRMISSTLCVYFVCYICIYMYAPVKNILSCLHIEYNVKLNPPTVYYQTLLAQSDIDSVSISSTSCTLSTSV